MSNAKNLLTVGLALVASGLVSCSIPKPECTIGQSSTAGIGLTGVAAFSVRYIPAGTNTGECANLKGDVIGFQSYHPASTTDPQTRDFSKTSIAIRPMSVGELDWMNQDLLGKTEQFCFDGKDDDDDKLVDDADPDCHATGVGDFTATEPDATDMCQVTPITQHIVFPGLTYPSDPTQYPLVTDAIIGKDCAKDTDCNATVNAVCDTKEKKCAVPSKCTADADCNAVTAGACTIPEGETEGTCGIASACTADADCGAVSGATCFPDNTCAVPYDLPKADLQYDWTNVSVYVTAAAVGTQFSADLKITLNGSTCNYKAIGIWPAVDCGVYDDSGAVTGTDQAFCDPNPDAPNGRPVGSGINPDFGPIVCTQDVAVVPTVDAYYSIPDVADSKARPPVPLSVPRCAIDTTKTDKIPALGGSSTTPK